MGGSILLICIWRVAGRAIRGVGIGIRILAVILGPLFIALGTGRTAPAAEDFVLAANRVGQVILGLPESAIYRIYRRQITRKVDLQVEGSPTPAVLVFLTKDRQHPALIIRLDDPARGVYGVKVMDSRFRTARGIGAGSSLGRLRATEKPLSLAIGEGQFGAVADELGHDFLPDTGQRNRKGPPPQGHSRPWSR